ncbi:hypothetical protein [Sinomonas mesophila]|uniref:hypothetical protein n=1 Tax=Sinomonas mesophila TaxID=1531955 RepID=UPI00158B694B|nr:hypothetical protein [Sinomonas mesophila]
MGTDNGTSGLAAFDIDAVDLSETVTNLSRVKSKNRARLANSDLTRAFLNAALSLTDHLLGPGGEDSAEVARQSLAYLSRPRIVGRAREAYPELVPTEAKFRDRWAGQQDFLSDFVAYALKAREGYLRRAIDAWADELACSGGDFASAIHRVAFEGMSFIADQPAYRLQLLLTASAEADPIAAEALRQLYASMTAAWFGLYRQVVERFGLRLRAGVRAQEVNIILQSLAEGLGLRVLAGVEEPLVNRTRGTSLLGTAALALLSSLVDDGDGLTLAESANERIGHSMRIPSDAGGNSSEVF